jgi:hypothetical protein
MSIISMIYTQSNITQASYSPEYITPTQQIFIILLFILNENREITYPHILKSDCGIIKSTNVNNFCHFVQKVLACESLLAG